LFHGWVFFFFPLFIYLLKKKKWKWRKKRDSMCHYSYFLMTSRMGHFHFAKTPTTCTGLASLAGDPAVTSLSWSLCQIMLSEQDIKNSQPRRGAPLMQRM
jgi:hypothetical protein